MTCDVCPRRCRNRVRGFCGVGEKIMVARVAPHFWEEPVISGKKGSGTVFFSGCSLRCVFCQNAEISARLNGRTMSEEELDKRIKNMLKSGVHNVNFVTPTHYSAFLSEFLKDKNYGVPTVFNTGGYDTVKSIKNLKGKVQIFLPDMKYRNDALALKYSYASAYSEIAERAIEAMYDAVGDCEFGDDGLLKKGVIVRHLMLPDNTENTLDVIDWFEKFSRGKKVMFSLMCQYTPVGDLSRFPELQRPLRREEYEKAVNYCLLNGIDGYRQEFSSVGKGFIPDFELTEEEK